ncbi:MAG: Ig-like domain-containing protein, partial [bacterium]
MHRVDVDCAACCRVGGIDAVIAAFHSVIPVQVFIRFTPVDRVTAVVDAHKGSVTGKGVQLTATVAPDDATNKAVTWSSDSPSVATVSAKGRVSGKTPGTALITATTVDGGFT